MLVIDKLGNIQEKEWENDQWEYKDIPPVSILAYLKESVEISNDFTLQSYFEMIKKYFPLQMLDRFFVDYLSEYEQVKNKINDESDIHFLELLRCVEYTNYDQPYIQPDVDSIFFTDIDKIDKLKTVPTENKAVDIFWNFHGIGDPDPQAGCTGYAIEFTPIGRILNKQIKINKQARIIINGFNYSRTEYEGESNINLFEFVSEIIWELSFAGTPDMRDDKIKEILESVDECKKEFSGEPE